ncbi:MAG: hydroxysqualene dehydroxylase HpnE [Alphaproteobacteria bacterium]|nr:hydroxysqualene dehydroxylase HpnE [Alphaproteobacteria bacterium]
MSVVHIVGAGLAGLAAAVRLAGAGRQIALYEAANHAGGRCRSYVDATLGKRVDNGNHLLFRGNREAFGYLKTIGAVDRFLCPNEPAFPFVDLESGDRWVVRPSGLVPWWVFSSSRRIPGTKPADYLAALRLFVAKRDATIAETFADGGLLYRYFWEPLAVASLNTSAERGAVRLLLPVVLRIFGKGSEAARPMIARDGLSESFVDPALNYLQQKGGQLHFTHRLRAVAFADGRVSGLDFGTRRVVFGEKDRLILAVPPANAGDLLPGLATPKEAEPILNAHFDLPEVPSWPHEAPFVGVIGGLAQWVFLRGRIASVTVSAAADHIDKTPEELVPKLWEDVAQALQVTSSSPPPCRILKERRATFSQTPAALLLRPKTRTQYANLFLAGDWTDTGLPATIEGAIFSGHRAAKAAMQLS